MTPAAKGPSLERFGIAVGHASDDAGATGLTVIRGIKDPLRASCAVIGRATGSRELALLEPGHLVERIDAILLAGGSAFGLDAAAGVMRWMERNGRGFPVATGVVPIVPAAVLFDLGPLGTPARPTAAMAEAACEGATSSGIAEGSVGAGTGLTVGKIRGRDLAMKGGFGLAIAEGHGCSAVAMAAVNAFGDVRDAGGRIIAGARAGADARSGTFADTAKVLARGAEGPPRAFGAGAAAPNTTLAVVALDAAFSKLELQRIARAATAAYHRRLSPAGSSFDGDIVFALSPLEGPRAPLAQAEMLAVAALEDALERAVRLAKGRDGVPGLAD